MTKLNDTLIGGDLASSLSNHELDNTLRKIAKTNKFIILPSDTSVRSPNIQHAISEAQQQNKQIIFIFWCRFHWVLCHIQGEEANFYDSAPSPAVRNDIIRFCKLNNINYNFKNCPRQIRDSQECGIFAISYAWIIINGMQPSQSKRVISLKHVRNKLTNDETIQREDVSSLIEVQGAGETSNWIAVHDTLEQRAAAKKLCYMLTATIISNAARELMEIAPLPTSIRALTNMAQRLGFAPDTENDLAETIMKMQAEGTFPGTISFNKNNGLSSATGNPNIMFWVGENENDTPSGWKEILRAKFSGNITTYENGGPSATSGHYVISNSGQFRLLSKILKPLQSTQPKAARVTKKHEDATAHTTHLQNVVSVNVIAWTNEDGSTFEYLAEQIQDNNEPAWRVLSTKCMCGGWRRSDHEDEAILSADHKCITGSSTKYSGPSATCICSNTPASSDELQQLRDSLNYDIEKSTLRIKPSASSASLRGNAGEAWFIYDKKPPHVHDITWKGKAPSTRDKHRNMLKKIKGMRSNLRFTPFITACIDTVLQEASDKSWAWSTIATNLSSLATALKDLPSYTNETNGIDISKNYAFMSTMQRAQKLARIHASKESTLTTPMTVKTYNQLTRTIAEPAVRLLLDMSWHFAARVGDMRQVLPANVKLAPNNKNTPTKVQFVSGKGGAFWGPYTIAAVIPSQVKKDMAEFIKQRAARKSLWTEKEQRSLSVKVKKLELKLCLRSIRRGALLDHAGCGASDNQLQLLSGHKRTDTLMRYLGWGKLSTTAHAAAMEREELRKKRDNDDDSTKSDDNPCSDDSIDDDTIVGDGARNAYSESLVAEPRKMGTLSGYQGVQGRRIQPPPAFFWERPPSSTDIDGYLVEDRDLPLHVKHVGTVSWEEIIKIASKTKFSEEVEHAKSWMCPEAYNAIDAELSKGRRKIYDARFSPEQISFLASMNRIVPSSPEEIRSYVNSFGHPERSKFRQRVLNEPWLNRVLQEGSIMKLHYTSRAERRADILDYQYCIQFDMASYYDQFTFFDDANIYFGMRTVPSLNPSSNTEHTHWKITRLPMGAKFSTAVAQSVTWALCDKVRSDKTNVTTMIDNVRIASNCPTDFVRAVRLFLENVGKANITLNEDVIGWNDDIILQKGKEGTTEEFTFLGETYMGNTIKNSKKSVDKLIELSSSIAPGVTTRRKLAATIGLALFMAHTLYINLAEHGSLFRAYANLFRGNPAWDEPLKFIDMKLINKANSLFDVLTTNTPVNIKKISRPGTSNNDYDATLVIDACAEAWGARIRIHKTGEMYKILKAFPVKMSHSAHAEPKAVTEALRYVKQTFPTVRSVALVTDHYAIPAGQLRWWSRYGGVSTSFYLNEAFAEMFEYAEAFYVEGCKNITDADSRSEEAKKAANITCQNVDMIWPNLENYKHPYAARERPKGF